MKPYHNLLLNTISVSILTPIILVSYFSLSHYYFFNQYANAAAVHSSLGLQKATGGNGIQICYSWGNEIANGVLTYRIDDHPLLWKMGY